jgi:N-acetylglucosaminyl-diphospho-decaprenol L-rhamnosyltransferase
MAPEGAAPPGLAQSPVLLSILIVNWNVRELLRACLLSVQRELRLPPEQYEVIVLDNASADGSVAMLREQFGLPSALTPAGRSSGRSSPPPVRLIESDVNLGFAAGCNRAYEQARGAFVLLLNPDTQIVDSALDGLLAVLQAHPRAGVVAPRLMHADRGFQRASCGALPSLRNTAWNYLFLQQLLPRRWAPPALFIDTDVSALTPVEWVSGCCMLLRREALGDTIFDEAYFLFGEDMDLCRRLRSTGWSVLYDGGHSIVHHHGSSFEQQDTPAVKAAAHHGPRRVFAKGRSRASVLIYDAILFVGYAVRWPLYALLERLRPGRGYGARARFSLRYVRSMFERA